MAAYAALVSLEHIIHNLHHHSRPPISLHKEQAHILTQKVTFLQEFLQLYNPNLPYSKEADPLESRIARAAYAAEDAIESHISDKLTNNGNNTSSDGLYKVLEKVIQDMESIEKEAVEINKVMGRSGQFLNQLHAKSTTPEHPSISPIAKKKSMMVGADDLLLELKDKLTSYRSDLQTLPIVGMGGSGKTTLALSIYQDRLIEEHFDICAWVAISQEYILGYVLKQLRTQLIKEFDELIKKFDHELSEGELGEMLHKHLFGRRYMIVLDDVWSVEACDGVKKFLPNNSNGSRIVITTRITNLVSALPNSNSIGMKLLDEGDSWGLLSKVAFRENGCPSPEFEDVGRRIGKSCKGLPLSIVVIGGLLAKCEQAIELWEDMDKNLNAIVNLEEDERCLKTLYMSYKKLPVHLKPCFLYMGIYREDHQIRISKVVRLWVAEGFLKPVRGKGPEDVARDYLKDLIDRNLILVHKLGSIGSIKYCKVHDLLRDLCLREARKQGFYTVYPGHEAEDGVCPAVISAPNRIPKLKENGFTMPLGRSLMILDADSSIQIFRPESVLHSRNRFGGAVADSMLQLVNSRFLSLSFTFRNTDLSRSICLFWNLHTLIVQQLYGSITVPADIWYMSHIRHLYVENLRLPDPPPNVEANGIVLQNLQTLGMINDFTCSEEVVKRIPNIKKLRISYMAVDDRLANLDSLDRLESLTFIVNDLKCQINYPQSLKKLDLSLTAEFSIWYNTLDTIGELPLLEKLKLCGATTEGGPWETRDGQFRSLKFLHLQYCEDMRGWTSGASHFPRLEHLYLAVQDLEEIPLDFADIATLRMIDMYECRDSLVESAKRILEEQEELYGEDETTLQVQVALSEDNNPALERLRSSSFRVTCFIPNQIGD